MSKAAPVAVIDLGTHSALLLIAEKQAGNGFTVLKEDFKVTRLGAGIEKDEILLPQNQENTFKELREFKKEIEAFGCGQVTVLATEAMRRAANALTFLDALHKEFNWQVKVLTPEEEARFSFLGAISVYEDFTSKLFTVIDVGGGSTEITKGRGKEIERSRSFPVGVVRLAERFDYRERMVSFDIPTVQEILDAQFDAAELKKLTEDTFLVGTGGTITTAAAIHHGMETYDPNVINNTSLTLDQLLMMFEDLNARSLEERRQVKGLEAGREDVIIYGLMIYIHLMQRAGVWRIRISAGGLRHGFLLANV